MKKTILIIIGIFIFICFNVNNVYSIDEEEWAFLDENIKVLLTIEPLNISTSDTINCTVRIFNMSEDNVFFVAFLPFHLDEIDPFAKINFYGDFADKINIDYEVEGMMCGGGYKCYPGKSFYTTFSLNKYFNIENKIL